MGLRYTECENTLAKSKAFRLPGRKSVAASEARPIWKGLRASRETRNLKLALVRNKRGPRDRKATVAYIGTGPPGCGSTFRRSLADVQNQGEMAAALPTDTL